MSISRRGLRAIAALLGVVGLAAASLTACGDDSGSGTEAQDSLTYAVASPIKSLDVNAHLDNSAQILLGGNVLETLTKVSKDSAGNVIWVPMLAQSYERIGPSQWRFHLLKGVKFSNGQPMTANDVVYSVTKRLSPESEPTSVLSNIDHAVKVDDDTVDIFSKKPDNFVDRAVYYIYIQPDGWGKTGGDANAEVIGTGPYQFDSMSPAGDTARITRWDGYRGNKPALGEIDMRAIPEAGSRLAALMANEVQVSFQLDPDLLTKAPAKLTMPGGEVVMGRIATQNPPFDNLNVRKALNMAIDRDTLINKVRSGLAVPAKAQSIVPSVSGYDPNLADYPYDPEQAKKLVADAGATGHSLSLMCLSDKYGPVGRNECQTIGQMFTDIGFNVQIDMQPDDKWISNGLLAPGNKLKIPDVFWVPTSSTNAGANMTSWYSCDSTRATYCDPVLTKQIDDAQAIENIDAQATAWQGVMRYIKDKAPMVWLDVPQNAVATAAGVKGVVYPVLQDIYWSEWSKS
jgi:peptide/nickel transport system substrate-binding protein